MITGQELAGILNEQRQMRLEDWATHIRKCNRCGSGFGVERRAGRVADRCTTGRTLELAWLDFGNGLD